MKRAYAVLLPAVVVAAAITPNRAFAESGFAVTSRGADFNILQKTTSVGSTNRVHRYIQVATGLNYRNAWGQWTPSQPVISILPQGGGAATQGLHQVWYPGDIGNGVIKIATPDGRTLQNRPLFVTLDDGVRTVVIGVLTNSPGWLTASNQVTYKNCFSGDIKADLVCTYRLSGAECDLVFRTKPPVPSAYGLSDADTTIQLVTEFFNTADPQQIPSAYDDWFGLQDQTLKFGKMTMGHGKAFATQPPGTPKPAVTASTPVYKSWLHLGGRTFLVEEVPLVYLADDLDALPLTAAAGDPQSKVGGLARAIESLPARMAAPDTRQIQIASADLNQQPGVVLDYNVVDYSTGDYTFYSANTYFVSGGFNFDGTLTIQGDCVLKFPEDGSGSISMAANTIVCPSDPTLPSMLTSVNDDSVGEPISGLSTGSPATGSGVYLAFNSSDNSDYYGTDSQNDLAINNLNFAYAGVGLSCYNFRATVSNCQFLNCGTGIGVADDSYFGFYADPPITLLTLNNVLIAGGNTAVDVSGMANVFLITGSQVTADVPSFINGVCPVTIANSILLDEFSYWDLGNIARNGVAVDTTGSVVFPSPDTWTGDPDMSVYRTAYFTTVGNAHYYPAANSPYSSLGYQYPAMTDTDYDGLADSWELYWFGNLSHTGGQLDSGGVNTLLADYQSYVNGVPVNPNIIQFHSIEVTNNYVTTQSPPAQLNITGYPYYMAVLVDDTNLADAAWTTYVGSNITVNIGNTQGWHGILIGLRGYADAVSAAVWQTKRLKLGSMPPPLVITSPINGTVSVPLIQLKGYSAEELDSISCDVSNALGVVSGLQVDTTDRGYNTDTSEFTTNYFECLDVPLTNGLNTITIHAADLAGNISSLSTNITLDYSCVTNPVIQLFWPRNGEQISGTSFTWRGWVDDPTAAISASITDTNGNTTMVQGYTERNGNFWVENLPMANGTNSLMLCVTNAAGFGSITNVAVSTNPLTVTMTPVPDSQLWNATVTATGTISDSTYSLWINGIKAGVTNGIWTATNVPMTPGGVAIFDITTYAPGETQPDNSHSN